MVKCNYACSNDLVTQCDVDRRVSTARSVFHSVGNFRFSVNHRPNCKNRVEFTNLSSVVRKGPERNKKHF